MFVTDRRAVVAGLCATVAVTQLIYQGVGGRFIDRNGHCGDDGLWYCAMARGQRGQQPFSRRVLAPWIVDAMHFGSVPTRFLVLDVVSLLTAALLIGLLTRQLAGARSTVAAVFAGGVFLLFPFAWQFSVLYPVITEPLSVALGIAWLLSVTRDKPGWVLPGLLAAAATLTRESWVLPIVVAAAVIGISRRAILPRLIPSAALSLAALAIAMTRPAYPGVGETGIMSTAKMWLHDNFSSPTGFRLFIWFVVFGLGLFWLTLVPHVRWVWSDWRRRTVLAVALSHAVLAAIGGSDTGRLLLESGVCLLVLTAVAFADGVVAAGPLTVLLTATFVLWRPWHLSSPSYAAYIDYWAVREAPASIQVHRIHVDLAVTGAAVLVAVTTALAGGRARGGSGHTRTR